MSDVQIQSHSFGVVSQEKKLIPILYVLLYKMGVTGRHHVKWNKPDSER